MIGYDDYRRWWWRVAVVICFAGAGVATITAPPGVLITVAVCAATLTPAIHWAYTRRDPEDQSIRAVDPPTWINLAASACLATAAGVASLGVIAVLGSVALPVIAAIVFTSPAVIGRLWSRALSAENGDTQLVAPLLERPPATTTTMPVAALSDQDLCRSWRLSFVALQVATDCRTRIDVVEHRHALLEELCLRDPAGFGRWISSGARAGSDPSPFITRPDRR